MTSNQTSREPLYHHTQVGYAVIWIVGLIVLADAVFLLLLSGKHGVPPFALLPPLAVAAILFACLLLFGSLTVTITREEIKLQFGIGLIQKRFRPAQIVSVRRVRNSWWYGWGIHWWPFYGWIYNVSGLDAVEIEERNGRRDRIGTDEPDQLEAAILQAMR